MKIDFSEYKAVIFDLDGTLLDSMWMWHQVDVDFLKKHNMTVPDDFHKEIEGMSFSETAEYCLKRFELDMSVDELKAEWSEMAEYYYCNEVKTKPGVIKLLEHLKSIGIKMGIATSNDRELTHKTISANGIHEYFTGIKTSCEVEKGKPYPYVYLACAAELKVDPKDCIAFEDTEAGLEAALSAGMKVVSIYDSFSEKYHQDMKVRSDYFIDSFEDLEL